jgi:hypothetical protein
LGHLGQEAKTSLPLLGQCRKKIRQQSTPCIFSACPS